MSTQQLFETNFEKLKAELSWYSGDTTGAPSAVPSTRSSPSPGLPLCTLEKDAKVEELFENVAQILHGTADETC